MVTTTSMSTTKIKAKAKTKTYAVAKTQASSTSVSASAATSASAALHKTKSRSHSPVSPNARTKARSTLRRASKKGVTPQRHDLGDEVTPKSQADEASANSETLVPKPNAKVVLSHDDNLVREQGQSVFPGLQELAAFSSAHANASIVGASAANMSSNVRGVTSSAATDAANTANTANAVEATDMAMDAADNALNTTAPGVADMDIKVLPITYALSLLSQLLPIPLHVFDSDGHYLKRFDSGAEETWNVLQTDIEYRKQLIAEVQEKKIILLGAERPVYLGGVAVADNLILIVGPVVTHEVDANFCKLFAARHQAINTVMQVCPPTKLASMLLLIHSALTGEMISLTSFLDRYFMHEDLIKQASEKAAEIFYNETVISRPHNPISFERDIIDAIKQGNLEALDRALNSPFASMRGVLATDPLRSQKNLSIVDITIASRAMIDTGFSAEEGFTVSDAFIRNVEECKDVEEAKAVARACAQRCTQLVKEQKKHDKNKSKISSPLVQQACDYIDRHAYAKLDVKAIADDLNVSVGHLSKLFKQEQHLTMSDYMRRRKIDLAAMMLANTDKTIADIADTLSFCSQSHFGAVFFKEKGCTPAAYRKRVMLQSGNHHMV